MNIQISYKLHGIEAWKEFFKTPISEDIDPEIYRAGQVLWRLVRSEAPVRTGKLRNSIFLRFRGPRSFLIGEGVDYGIYVRRGTRAHIIRPREKKALWWPGLPHPVAIVHHPGTRPNDYMARALERFSLPSIGRRIIDRIKRRDP